ncbi:hypothetical protein ACFYOT_26430 [Saccharothrix saharensis]|uniref:hypothetical protein n=1 Tax=Saccharothrix saharensis TaxID=571190 RepID=UPI0036C96638
MSVKPVHTEDPRYHEALDRSAEQTGMRLEHVLLPTQWTVMEVDGQAELIVTADGVRALAVLSPMADAAAIVEDILRQPGINIASDGTR